ncbi:MAG: leucyl/phenylalanyl-tRNA--protein transferase [Pyrinomonadaceae bacterium]
MASDTFPDPLKHKFAEWAKFGEFYYHASDIIGFGGELNVDNLHEAYIKGIFPWHIEGMPLPWFCPEKRAILEFENLHISKSLAKERRRSGWTFTIDEDFVSVICACAETPRNPEDGTWITSDFIRSYTELHNSGEAHSVEVWNENGELIGGLYGVDAGGVFCGESMFFRKPNASKLALLFLIDHLRERGSSWIDIQVMTPHMKIFGAAEIDRIDFLNKLKSEQNKQLRLFDDVE